MKKIINLVILLTVIATASLFAQNQYEKTGYRLSAQEIQNRAFEFIDEAIRTTFVPKSVAVFTTILESASLGDSIYLGDGRVIGFDVPASKSTGVLTFQTWSSVDSAWVNFLDNDGTEITYTPADSGTGSRIKAVPIEFAGIENLKIRNGTSTTPVPVLGGDQTIGIIKRRY